MCGSLDFNWGSLVPEQGHPATALSVPQSRSSNGEKWQVMMGEKGGPGQRKCAGQGRRRCVWEVQWMLVNSVSSCRVHAIAEKLETE